MSMHQEEATEMKESLEQPIGDMTLVGLQEALRPAIHEVVAEIITDVREEGFKIRYDQPTEVLISTMAVRVDEMEKDITEIKARLGRLEENLEVHRRDNGKEFKALYQELAAHRQENAEEFKAVRREMAEGFAALRGEFEAHRQENDAEFKAIRQEMAAEFKAVRQEMAAEFKAMRREMRRQLMWMVGTMIAIGSLIVAVVMLAP